MLSPPEDAAPRSELADDRGIVPLNHAVDATSPRASFKSRLFLTAARNLAIVGTRASTTARARPSGPVLEDPP
jgi:hypothetical protein